MMKRAGIPVRHIENIAATFRSEQQGLNSLAFRTQLKEQMAEFGIEDTFANRERAIVEIFRATYPGCSGFPRQLSRLLHNLVNFRLLSRQAHDLRGVPEMIDTLAADHLFADRAFDADWLRTSLVEQSIAPVIPPKSNRRFPAEFDKETYKWRHLIENYSGKRKENRIISMRSCKTDQSFKAFILLAASIIQLR